MVAQQLLNGSSSAPSTRCSRSATHSFFGVLDILNLAHAGDLLPRPPSPRSRWPPRGCRCRSPFSARRRSAACSACCSTGLRSRRCGAATRGTLVPLISSIGVAIIIGAVLRGIYGVDERHFVTGGLDTASAIHLGPVTFTTVELTIFVAAVALMVVLSWVLRATTLGRRIRAVAQDRIAAALLGVDLERTIAATFFIASSLGGAAGVLTGLEYNSSRSTWAARSSSRGWRSSSWAGWAA